jgi:hypothetical protein
MKAKATDRGGKKFLVSKRYDVATYDFSETHYPFFDSYISSAQVNA